MAGQWMESSSQRFSNVIQFAPKDLFNGPGLKMLRETINLNEVESMLSIGSGNGRFDLALMAHYPMTVDFIEPSPVMHAQLVENLDAHKGPGKVGRVFHGPFEAFSTETRYDLVFAVHSFYFMKDPIEATFRSLSLLNSGGQLVIILHMSDSFGVRFAKEFSPSAIHGGLTADSLQSQLGSNCSLSVIEGSIPYDEFIQGDSLSPRGQLGAAFYAQREWDSFSPAEKKRAREFVDQCADGQVLRERYGLLHMRPQ